MSNKADLQRKLSEIGYEIGPFASKDTLSNVLRLHSLTLQNTGINVSELNDLDLRKSLTEHGLSVGPVTNHTRSIYQRKLLEVLTNERSEGNEDEIEIEAPISKTPPRNTRSSILRTTDTDMTSSPGRSYLNDVQEARIPLTRVDIDEKIKKNLSPYYPNVSNTKQKPEETITSSYSPQRSSTKPETRPSTVSYGLRNPYDFQSDEPVIIRHEHKATPFRVTNISSGEIFTTNQNRYGKQSDLPPTSTNDFNEIRSRVLTSKTEEKSNIPLSKDSTSKKPVTTNQSETKKLSENGQKNAVAKKSGTYLYAGITLGVALIVFVLYLLFEN